MITTGVPTRRKWLTLLVLAAALLVFYMSVLIAREVKREEDGEQLIAAIKRCDSDRALLLLRQVADPNARESSAASAFERLRAAVQRLIDRKQPSIDSPSALMLVLDVDRTMGGQNPEPTALVEALLRSGADANAVTSSPGWYASPVLHHAASCGYSHCVQALIAHGANVNARNEAGTTPLMLAGNVETLVVLIANGADVNSRTYDGMSVLSLARHYQSDSAERVRLLKSAGAHD